MRVFCVAAAVVLMCCSVGVVVDGRRDMSQYRACGKIWRGRGRERFDIWHLSHNLQSSTTTQSATKSLPPIEMNLIDFSLELPLLSAGS